MEAVRAVMWQHAATRLGARRPDATPDALLPAEGLRELLESKPEQQVKLARDYAQSWSSLYPTLVTQLRGRPEDALLMFCKEVYPFLRGHTRAARIEDLEGRRARVSLALALPPAYVAALCEAFVALSGAAAAVHHEGGERFDVRFHVAPQDRFVRLVRQVAALRIPLLGAAAFAVLVGLAAAWGANPDRLRAAAVLAGALAVQLGANALHDRLSPSERGFLRPSAWSRPMRQAMLYGGYGVGGAIGIWLAMTSTWWILAFGAAGVLTSLLYRALRDEGVGPLMAAVTYGPLMTLGAFVAQSGGPMQWTLLAASATTAGLAGAMVQLADMADRPFDQAAGRRTLAVRLPEGKQVVGLGLFLIVAAASLAALAGGTGVWWPAIATVPMAWIIVMVARNLDATGQLARARLALFSTYALTAGALGWGLA